MEIQFLKRGENFSGVIYISKNNSEVVGNGERVVTAFAVKEALQGVGLILFSEKRESVAISLWGWQYMVQSLIKPLIAGIL